MASGAGRNGFAGRIWPPDRSLETPELDDGELDEQKCTQKIGILLGPTKKWRNKRIDELDDDELDEFYCTSWINSHLLRKF